MEIKNETIEVSRLTHDEKGDKLEPEQVPARRLLDVSDTITLTGSNGEAHTTAAMPMSISVEMPAGELALGMSQPCFSCRHFDQRAMQEWKRAREATPDGRAELQAMREELIRSSNAEVEDVEFALQSMGVCRILSEARNDVVTVYPVSTCPDTLPNSAVPFPRSYQPRTSDDARQSSQVFDSIMRTAQGRR